MTTLRNPNNTESSSKVKWLVWAGILIGLPVLAFCLAWVSTHYQGVDGWLSFMTGILIATGILWLGWLTLKAEKPPLWLRNLLLAATLLRLAAGVFWFVSLPNLGHNTPSEQAGYIMADASARDQVAWKLAKSSNSLWIAFQGQRKVDQYGGLLFISAALYRYLGGNQHQPLLMVLFTASVSALAVLYTWGFARRAYDSQIAKLAAWIIALLPEAIMLGSAQMREAFTITFVMVAFYGLLRYQQERNFVSLSFIIAPLILYLPFSPPFTALLLAMLGITFLTTFSIKQKNLIHQRSLWIILSTFVIFILFGLWLALRQFTPEGMNNPFAMLSWWLRKSAYLQAYYSKHASGLIQYIFERTPVATHLPLLIAYGVVQPFLPAAMVATSQAPIWPWITLVRSIGWTAMLTFLIYAPFLAFSKKHRSNITVALIAIVWLGILVASYRGGGDLWDNPRYRTTFTGLQSVLVAWVWVNHKRNNTPWLRRILLGILGFMLWLVPWYIRRYTAFYWPVQDILKALALGFLTAFGLNLLDWIRTRSR